MRHKYKKFYFLNTSFFHCQLIRPCLDFSRFEFFKFCLFWHLPIYPDNSNFCLGLKRNRLRVFFLPYLKIFFNKNVFQKIYQLQKLLYEENHYFEHFFQKYNVDQHFTYFQKLPRILQNRFIYRFFFFMKKKISFLEISCLFHKIFTLKNK